jgi:hypothetical protein
MPSLGSQMSGTVILVLIVLKTDDDARIDVTI